MGSNFKALKDLNWNNLGGFVSDLIPKELPSLPSLSSMGHNSMNPDDDSAAYPSSSNPNDTLPDQPRARPKEPWTFEPQPIVSGPRSNLDLLNDCDNFPYIQTDSREFKKHIEHYYALHISDYPDTDLGYVLPRVARAFGILPGWKLDDEYRELILEAGYNEVERSAAVAASVNAMRAAKCFDILTGWRDELYPIYGPPPPRTLGQQVPPHASTGELLFSIERAASALLGIITYGCHMTAFTRATPTTSMQDAKIWVARRSPNKQTYPNMLDNTVAGGLATGEKPFEGMVREAQEEAGFDETFVRTNLRAAGTVSYFHIRDHRAGGETCLLMPECQYVYDLELDEDTVPRPADSEVAGFELKTVGEVKDDLRAGRFKPNCALVLLDFFIRHGIITPGNEPAYAEIVARLHRRLDFPTM